MLHPVENGKRTRMSYSRIKEACEMPNFIEVQTASFDWFLHDGLKEAFDDISPIDDNGGSLVLEFVNYTIGKELKYTEEESRIKDTNYSAPLRARVRLINKDTGEVKEQEVFMGDIPIMTDKGTFIINGGERVVVSQVVRSPGCYYKKEINKNGELDYSATIIPNRGAWLEFETDASGALYVKIDKNRKVIITSLLRALGVVSDLEIVETLGETNDLLTTLEKDTAKTQDEALIEIYKRLRPGEPEAVDSAKSLLNNLFFDPKRYDLAKVGRYKFNKKLSIARRIENHTLAMDAVNPITGELIYEKGTHLDRPMAQKIEDNFVNTIDIVLDNGEEIRVVGNNFVYPEAFDTKVNFEELGLKDKIYAPLMHELMDEAKDDEELKNLIIENIKEIYPKRIEIDDIISSINYQFNLMRGVGQFDNIDHLGNRRVRSVGELLQNQFRIGLSRMERVIRERMTTQDPEAATPQSLINIRPVVASLKEFFGSSQLSQFMDQTNPLSELTHKRRMSALGPGGLSRDRAGFEVRDIHNSQYARMCPIETPEGPNIGLITSLASFARINEYGFIEAPYRKVEKGTGKVSDEIEYISADIEDECIIAQANEPIDEKGYFKNDIIVARSKAENDTLMDMFRKEEIDYMDVSPRQIVSVGTAMIPFLENDDANRALMGSNMQRQAVPLLMTEAPIVATGIEYKAAKDSGVCVVAKNDGIVKKVDAKSIVIENKDKNIDSYKLIKFTSSNQGTTINQRPIVQAGEKVKKGDVIADGPSTNLGEMSLGKNILVAFMTWEGYNYEDAILINERLVYEDVLTSIHIEEYESESRDTKLGPEEITRDIPNTSEELLKNLDKDGIIRIGAEVKAGDILVGKVTPKGEKDLPAEERLLRAIFGEKSREVRDTSLKVPHGEAGIVVDVKEFTRENADELSPGVNRMVRVYIATKRKISVGDKMCGRHGNKGVISRILPEEDMPYLPDGTPLQILLNPMGVPSRMNLGQVLEVHLGMAAKKLGMYVSTPVFDGANENDILEALDKAGYPKSGKIYLRDGRTGKLFDNPVTVGYMYMLKLHHLVDEKIHARSIGPYSLVTQQPLGGKAQFGGQRFGEMEVWALEGYGASHVLQEILTVKSDDINGRVKTYEAIVKGKNIPEPGIPESFKVLVKELQSLLLDVKVLDQDDNEMELDDEDDFMNEREIIAGDFKSMDTDYKEDEEFVNFFDEESSKGTYDDEDDIDYDEDDVDEDDYDEDDDEDIEEDIDEDFEEIDEEDLDMDDDLDIGSDIDEINEDLDDLDDDSSL